MAYRRRQEEEEEEFVKDSSSSMKQTSNPNPKLNRPIDSSLSSRQLPNSYSSSSSSSSSLKDDSTRCETKNADEPKHGFWGALARKARAIIDADNHDVEANSQVPENPRKADNPALHKGLNAVTSSFSYIGNALEEGMAIVENRTAEIIQKTRKLNIKKKPDEVTASNARQLPQTKTDTEIQLMASRDVSMAMAAKAKVLLRELKTVKADMAFAKERCAQLEEENKILRETGGGSDRPEDDDLIRLQLESLLAEKARLAQENSVYARENRFLREIVEYHQLTMQDVVYIDENREEVSEVYPINNLIAANNNSSVSPIPCNTHPRVTPTSPFALNADNQYKM
ncbi:uncharacterized protein LOC143533739 [Bidens hawaiensis]|uniref:uncharacterized protein LOC143533739 n=1 Tax=Bidens hawaiensis TaxID=980011 RepID=UPI0040492EA9